jgi:hypothetical protein
VKHKNDKPLQHSRSNQLRERAFFFKRLAIGAADPKFSAKLQVLVEEYEREADRAKLDLEQPATRSQTESAGDAPEHHTG